MAAITGGHSFEQAMLLMVALLGKNLHKRAVDYRRSGYFFCRQHVDQQPYARDSDLAGTSLHTPNLKGW